MPGQVKFSSLPYPALLCHFTVEAMSRLQSGENLSSATDVAGGNGRYHTGDLGY
jgi:hypothetical protein